MPSKARRRLVGTRLTVVLMETYDKLAWAGCDVMPTAAAIDPPTRRSVDDQIARRSEESAAAGCQPMRCWTAAWT